MAVEFVVPICVVEGCESVAIPGGHHRCQKHYDEDYRTCTGCGKVSDDVDSRYSFGIYAGKLCVACCAGYRDNCGIDQPQGDPTKLAEFEAGGWDAIDGEPE